MEECNLQFPYRARYYRSQPIGPGIRKVWFVLHGYGQLASYFVRKFSALENKGICIIAPEGLSRFYLQDVNTRKQSGKDRVGATWMTKENRQADIDNYVAYLTKIYELEIPPNKDIAITVLGFSQGAATASRWVMDGRIAFDRLILWSGVFPPDLRFSPDSNSLRGKETVFVYGDSDPFVTSDHLAEMEALSAKLQINPSRITFHGGHDIDTETLMSLI
ncbi:MAG TPA: alpha/beta hydrolase [Ohtaekwangia sp.]|nr:alpha/beta hydrolase [Ohtaekwangia sp.]